MRNLLTVNSLICQEQHSFVPTRSTTTNLLQCDEAISRYLNAAKSCDVILLDFARAFDKVSHRVLMSKLSSIGIYGELLAWLRDFMSNRTQFIFYQGAVSSPIAVESGVVQRSAIGLLLFTVMINDLPQQVTSLQMALFADDGKAVGKASSQPDCQRNQADLNNIHLWSIINLLLLSVPKCQCLHLGKNNVNYSYTIGGVSISVASECVDLGLKRTSDFKYDVHISSIVAKSSRSAGMLLRALSTRNELFMKKLFVAYIRPMLEYASAVWNPSSVGMVQDIERVQRRFTKRLRGLRVLSYEDRLTYLHLDKLEDRRRRDDLIIVFKFLHGLLAIDAANIGVQLSTAHTRSHDLGLIVHRAINKTVRKTFSFRMSTK